MASIAIHDYFRKRALVTREAARSLQEAFETLLTPEEVELILDFAGIDALTPSFVDEVLLVVEEILGKRQTAAFRILFLHTPTRLSEKFAAIGRAHEAEISGTAEGAWIISSPRLGAG